MTVQLALFHFENSFNAAFMITANLHPNGDRCMGFLFWEGKGYNKQKGRVQYKFSNMIYRDKSLFDKVVIERSQLCYR